jgi:hypothetical protein
VTGSQPAAPVIACYETATWNGVTCVWDVTGSQPAAPTALHALKLQRSTILHVVWDITGLGLFNLPYATKRWNGVTCVWDVTGSQQLHLPLLVMKRPWNGVTCVWDITGSQPAAPAIECYETATWNGVTCVLRCNWDSA